MAKRTKEVKCKDCANHKIGWCSVMEDSPDPELTRDCERFERKKKKGKTGGRKYRKGGKIRSLDELAQQEFVYFHDKIYHKGWFGSWQLMWCEARIKFGELRYAVKEDEDGEADSCR